MKEERDNKLNIFVLAILCMGLASLLAGTLIHQYEIQQEAMKGNTFYKWERCEADKQILVYDIDNTQEQKEVRLPIKP